jgi:hypothetical protein
MHGQMMRDLARTGGAPLIGRGATDPNVLSEIAFQDAHQGMSRATYAERERQWKRDETEAAILQEYQGAIPGGIVADTRGLSPKRAEFARYVAWKSLAAVELTELESTRAKLADMIEAPAHTESKITATIKRAARMLVAGFREPPDLPAIRAEDDNAHQHAVLEAELADQNFKSKAAREALPEIEAQISAKRKQLDLLQSRQNEFLRPAAVEIFEQSGIGRVYTRKVAEVAAMQNIINGFTSLFDTSPPSLADRKSFDLGRRHSWTDLGAALLADPRVNPDKYLPKFKA